MRRQDAAVSGGARITDAGEFFRLWHDRSKRVSDIAKQLGVSTTTVSATARRFGLGKREPVRVAEREESAPTPAEIRARIAEVQAKWSAEDRENRRVTKSRPVTVMRVGA